MGRGQATTDYQRAIPSGEFPSVVSLILLGGTSSWEGGLLWLHTKASAVAAMKEIAYTWHTRVAVERYNIQCQRNVMHPCMYTQTNQRVRIHIKT